MKLNTGITVFLIIGSIIIAAYRRFCQGQLTAPQIDGMICSGNICLVQCRAVAISRIIGFHTNMLIITAVNMGSIASHNQQLGRWLSSCIRTVRSNYSILKVDLASEQEQAVCMDGSRCPIWKLLAPVKRTRYVQRIISRCAKRHIHSFAIAKPIASSQ